MLLHPLLIVRDVAALGRLSIGRDSGLNHPRTIMHTYKLPTLGDHGRQFGLIQAAQLIHHRGPK